jgi:TetR/AcrR family transcriptional regulator, repressor of fatR-cypB operon
MNVHSDIRGAEMAGKTDKRKKIIKAALLLLTKHGFHAAPMSMIADKAGVGTGTIYTYFKDKDALINAIFCDIEEEIVDYLGKGLFESLTVKEKFIRFWTMLLNYLLMHPVNFGYLEQFHNSPFGTSLRRDRISGKDDEPSVFVDIIKEGIAKGGIKDMPVPLLTALAFGPIIMMARDQELGFIKLDETLIKQCAEACWDSICNDKAKLTN